MIDALLFFSNNKLLNVLKIIAETLNIEANTTSIPAKRLGLAATMQSNLQLDQRRGE